MIFDLGISAVAEGNRNGRILVFRAVFIVRKHFYFGQTIRSSPQKYGFDGHLFRIEKFGFGRGDVRRRYACNASRIIENFPFELPFSRRGERIARHFFAVRSFIYRFFIVSFHRGQSHGKRTEPVVFCHGRKRQYRFFSGRRLYPRRHGGKLYRIVYGKHSERFRFGFPVKVFRRVFGLVFTRTIGHKRTVFRFHAEPRMCAVEIIYLYPDAYRHSSHRGFRGKQSILFPDFRRR